MSLIYLDQTSEKQSVGALALGSFDGVHLGHRALLDMAVEVSKNQSSQSAALCFSPNPKDYFSTAEKPFFEIYNLDQNVNEILAVGLDKVFVKHFDRTCSQMTAESFLNFVLAKVDFKSLVVGFDFKFGKNRDGDHESLKKWCHENQVELNIIGEKLEADQKISSTRIKKLLQCGELEPVEKLLGRPHSYSGRVRSDQGLGRQIGFPTLNISLKLNTAIAHGVYVSLLHAKEKTYFSLSNVGTRPTVSNSMPNLALETHILSLGDVDITAGDAVRVELKSFIRPEKKFAGIDELRSQIAQDIVTAKSLADRYKH